MMDKKKLFKYFVILLLLVFTFIFMASEAGYYEYNLRKKMVLTNEAMEKFEEDVKNNENVDLNDYLESSQKNYKNNLTEVCSNVSKKINEYFKFGIDSIFSVINKVVGE